MLLLFASDEPPKERPKLQLQKRSKPIEEAAKVEVVRRLFTKHLILFPSILEAL